MKTIAIIPARMGSSRFPGKPLAELRGHPMIEHVYRRTKMAPGLDDVYIATCDQAIVEATEAFGGRAIMTSDEHQRASDRVAEAARSLDADVIVMVQGDEPMLVPEMVTQSAAAVHGDPSLLCSNLVAPIATQAEFEDRNTIKVCLDRSGDMLYLSREPVPTSHLLGWQAVPRLKQVCIITFSRAGLETFARLAPTPLEQAESIDMLRFLEHGYKVRGVPTECSTHAVDTPADLAMVERILASDPLVADYILSIG